MHRSTSARLGAVFAASAAIFAFASGPAMAAPTNGANSGCGNSCPTNVGDPSMNGNGGGLAVGKPGAGEVGKADDKNPPGQYADGGDANNGYECDGNNGIAKTNPAHTGCESSYPSS